MATPIRAVADAIRRSACRTSGRLLRRVAPSPTGTPGGFAEGASPEYLQATLSTPDGLALVKAFSEVKNPKLRRRIVDLIQEMVSPSAT